MPATLMLFVLTLGFIAFLSNKQTSRTVPTTEGERPAPKLQAKPRRAWAGVVLLIVFLITFFEFVVQPARTDYFTIKSVIARSPEERLLYYKKTFEASSMGKYQIRDFFAQHTQDIVRQNLEKVPKEILAKELDFVIEELKKTVKETPIDYRATLKLAQIHNVYALIDISKLALAEEYGKAALALSPNNQQSYWTLSQTKIYQKEHEEAIRFAKTAVELDTDWFNSHKILMEVTFRAGQYDKVREFAQEAIELKPEWVGMFDDILDQIPGGSTE